jgi:hypothetical protein
LLDIGAHLHWRNEYGQSAVYIAAWQHHLAATLLLIRNGAFVFDEALMRKLVANFSEVVESQIKSVDGAALNFWNEGLASTADFAGVSVMHIISQSFSRDQIIQIISTAVEALQSMFSFQVVDHAIEICLVHRTSSPFLASSESNSSASLIRPPKLTVLIDPSINHPGAGSYILDYAFSDAFLQQIEHLHAQLPVAAATKASCSDRSYYCDSTRFVQNVCFCESSISVLDFVSSLFGVIILPCLVFAFDFRDLRMHLSRPTWSGIDMTSNRC